MTLDQYKLNYEGGFPPTPPKQIKIKSYGIARVVRVRTKANGDI